MTPQITVQEEITLVSLHNIPADMGTIAEIFEKIASMDIDVDIISLSPVQGAQTSLFFTIKDESLIRLLEYTSGLEGGKAKAIVSGGNYIISVIDEGMAQKPGVAAKLFRTVSAVGPDIRIISTSEVQISLLVTNADFEKTLDAVEQCVKTLYFN